MNETATEIHFVCFNLSIVYNYRLNFISGFKSRKVESKIIAKSYKSINYGLKLIIILINP